MGRRIAKSGDGALTRYLYNEEDIWMAVTPAGTVIHYHHGPGIDEPLVAWASYEGSYWEPLYYFADALGTIRAAKGQDWLGRDMSATYEFDSYGQLMSSTSTLKAEWPLFTYTARESDLEASLLFLRRRQYDPRAGRFLSSDPVAAPDDHFYNYVNSQPLDATDPWGLMAVLNEIEEKHGSPPIIAKECGRRSQACTILKNVDLTCDCWCPKDTWKASCTLQFKGEMWLPMDNVAKMKAHEDTCHIDPAVQAAKDVIEPLEAKDFPNKPECMQEASQKAKEGREAFLRSWKAGNHAGHGHRPCGVTP